MAHIVNIYYKGFQIIGEGCDYKIKGLPMTFKTLLLAKNHIDFIKGIRLSPTTSLYF